MKQGERHLIAASQRANRAVKDIFERINDGSELFSPIAYSVLSPGKRIRPTLSLLVAEFLGVSERQTLEFGAAVEFLHAASLIHDDMPALDNDAERRGMPSCHVKFGEGLALLAGDGLVAQAFRLLVENQELSSEVRLSWVGLLSSTFFKLCTGQAVELFQGEDENPAQLDLFADNQELERVKRCHRLKTGALFSASATGPAFLIESKAYRAEVLPHLVSFGADLGLLFQVTDDLLDADVSVHNGEQPNFETGVEGLSYVRLLGYSGAKQIAADLKEKCLNSLARLKPSNVSHLEALVNRVSERKG